MKEQDSITTETRGTVSRGETRGLWGTVLLVAAVLVYGAGAVLLMVAPMSAAAIGWLAGTVSVLVALGLLTSSVRLTVQVPPALRRHHTDDPWAELWEERMKTPVQ